MKGTPDTLQHPWLAVAAALVQLGFAAAGAREVDFDHAPRPIAQYAALSGTDSSYGFFAPEVGTQLAARFELTSADGTKSTDVLTTGASHEADLRIGDMVAIFWMDDRDLQRSIAASWAGRMLARHPEAARVVVHLDAYEAEFVRRADLGADKELTSGGNP